MGSWKGRGNQYIEFVRALYCKLPTNGKQLPAFPLEAMPVADPRPQRWEASVTTLAPWPPKGQIKHSRLMSLLSINFLHPTVFKLYKILQDRVTTARTNQCHTMSFHM